MKIFCIGLSRSGAMTLNEALNILGYRSLFVMTYEHLEENLSKYDAFTHTPLAAIYRELDRRFPNSKFILNIRERENWLRSLERQWQAADSTGISEAGLEIRQRVYGTDQFNRETFARVYDQHLDGVSRYFKGRDQSLLRLDICAGEGFEILCPFLGKPIPSQPFPHQNSARSTFERPTQGFKRLLIRYLKARKIKQFLKSILQR
jgi:sulfotransferase family protein